MMKFKKLQSLVGVKVLLHTSDGVPVDPPMVAVFEEASELGLLFRSEKGHLLFASTASFTAMVADDR